MGVYKMKMIKISTLAKDYDDGIRGVYAFREKYIKNYTVINGAVYIDKKTYKKIRKIFKLLKELKNGNQQTINR
jgi:hypothetical protein